MVEITANDGEAITNELIRGEIHGLKTDENGAGLGGAVIGLFKSDESEFTAENTIATATSADDGSFSFTDVPYGNWVLKELESPEGFVLSDEVISVTIEEDGQVVEISFANERVYGDLRLTKVDKDYPDNKLTGAEFEVYRDTNGNKELDEGDEAMFHSGENCGNPQRLHRMTQRHAAFLVKSLHHASGSGNGIVLGGGYHAADLMHLVFRLVHQEGTSGLDASVVKLVNLLPHGGHFIHHPGQLILHAVDITHQRLHLVLLLVKAVLLQNGKKFNDLRMFPQGNSRFSHIRYLQSNLYRAGSACFLTGASSRQYSG